MSEQQSVIERAKAKAERHYQGGQRVELTPGAIINARTEAFIRGATFAATITPEQVDAAARTLWSRQTDDGPQPDVLDDYREDARAAFRAAGFVVEGES